MFYHNIRIDANAFLCTHCVHRVASKATFDPQEHAYNKSTGKYFYGADARLSRILYADGAIVDGKITCAKCNKFSVDISENGGGVNLRAEALRGEKFRSHELSCCQKL